MATTGSTHATPPQPQPPTPAGAAGTVTLGGELTVRRMGFGAMRVTGEGIWGPPLDADAARALLRRVLELGVDFIDTADAYGPEVSERLIAAALHPYPAGLVIATKGGLVRPGPGQWKPDGRPEHLRAACEASLRRLRLERIDVYQLHRIDPDVPADDQFGALKTLQDEGKIRLAALSNASVGQIEAARRIVDIVSVQNRYSLADRRSDDVVDYCAREGLAFLPWRPVADLLQADDGATADIARGLDATPAQVALAWLLQRSPTMLVIPGTGSAEHLEENVDAARLRLDDRQRARLTR